MPTYEYKCDKCGTSEDHYRTIDERDNFPNCQYCARITRRVMQANPVQFKAEGFYSTGG